MSLGNTTETDLLNLIFNATALPWNAVTKLDLHLHTADPGEAGNSSTSEATYGGYALVQVDRTSGGFTVAGNTVSNTALVQFDQCTSGSNTITHVSITPRATASPRRARSPRRCRRADRWPPRSRRRPTSKRPHR